MYQSFPDNWPTFHLFLVVFDVLYCTHAAWRSQKPSSHDFKRSSDMPRGMLTGSNFLH
jgi:hypothetical protein